MTQKLNPPQITLIKKWTYHKQYSSIRAVQPIIKNAKTKVSSVLGRLRVPILKSLSNEVTPLIVEVVSKILNSGEFPKIFMMYVVAPLY